MRFRGDRFARAQVVLVDDLKREGVEDDFFQLRRDAIGVVRGNQPHLARQLEVEVDDSSAGADARAVVDVPVGAGVAPGM